MKNEQKFKNVFNALILIAGITETDICELIDALSGYAWNEEEATRLKEKIPTDIQLGEE